MKLHHFIALLLFLSSLTWVFTLSDRLAQEIRVCYYHIIDPILKTDSALSRLGHWLKEDLKQAKVLKIKVDTMESELERLQLVEQRFRTVQLENDYLRKALDYKVSLPYEVAVADVTSYLPSMWGKSILLDLGKHKAIKSYQAVICPQGLVGKIEWVDKNKAAVLLLTDERCQVSAKIEGSAEMGVIYGQRIQANEEGLLQLKFLPKNGNFRVGQRVFTSGKGGVFPSNILIGEIVSIDTTGEDAIAYVKSAVQFSDLRRVFIIKGEAL